MNIITQETKSLQVAGIIPHTQVNLDAFYAILKAQYERLFETDSEYAYAKARTTPEAFARKMTLGLANGSANKDGDGIKSTCKHFGIPHTYKAIRAFLDAQ